jgi:hypothetical protein
MPRLLRNILAVLAGLIVGSAVNMAIVTFGPTVIAPPMGVDMSSAEGLARTMHLFEPRHFLTPFLAHALGTLVGALLAYLLAASHKKAFAWTIGVFFLCGGVMASVMIPAPAWFIATDLLLAYLPMAWLAIRIGTRLVRPTPGR